MLDGDDLSAWQSGYGVSPLVPDPTPVAAWQVSAVGKETTARPLTAELVDLALAASMSLVERTGQAALQPMRGALFESEALFFTKSLSEPATAPCDGATTQARKEIAEVAEEATTPQSWLSDALLERVFG